jgi:penicillin-binding protein 1A
MATALKDVAVQEVQPPPGLVQVDGEWRYVEWADGGFVRSLGLDGEPITPTLAVQPSAEYDTLEPPCTEPCTRP